MVISKRKEELEQVIHLNKYAQPFTIPWLHLKGMNYSFKRIYKNCQVYKRKIPWLKDHGKVGVHEDITVHETV